MCGCLFFFFKQKTAYEMRISDWSSDVCSSDLRERRHLIGDLPPAQRVPRAIGLAPQKGILAAARRAVEEHRDQTRKMVEMGVFKLHSASLQGDTLLCSIIVD